MNLILQILCVRWREWQKGHEFILLIMVLCSCHIPRLEIAPIFDSFHLSLLSGLEHMSNKP